MKTSELLVCFLFAVVAMINGCKTACLVEDQAIEGVTKVLAGYGECGGYDDMKADLKDLAEDLKLCSKDFDMQPHMSKIPNGACTPACIGCEIIGQTIAAKKKWPESWLCKKPMIRPEMVDAVCTILK